MDADLNVLSFLKKKRLLDDLVPDRDGFCLEDRKIGREKEKERAITHIEINTNLRGELNL